MIIVTGTARSRTSLMMNILIESGIEYEGKQHIDDNVNKFNKNGLFEVPEDCCFGHYGENTNKAIKIVLTGLYPNKLNYHKGTSSNILKNSKFIWCLRKPIQVAQSVKKMYPEKDINPSYSIYELCGFLLWADINRDIFNRMIIVETDSFFYNLENTLNKISSFIGKKIPFKKINEIVNKKETIINDATWPKKHSKDGYFIDVLYNLLLINDFNNAIEHVKERYKV